MATFVQGAASTTNVTPQTIPFPGSVTAGNLLVLCLIDGAFTAAHPTVTDTQGNTWSVVQRYADRVAIYWTKASATGSLSVTVTSTTSFVRFSMAEFGGNWPSNPVDVTSAGTTSTTSPTSSNSVTPSSANGVVIANVATITDSSVSVSGGYTLGATGFSRVTLAHQVFSTISAYTATFTLGTPASGVYTQNVAFIETTGGSARFRPYFITG